MWKELRKHRTLTKEDNMYPYLPKNRKILYVRPDNRFMRRATKLLAISSCIQPTAAVVVKNGKIVGRGANATKKIQKKIDICPKRAAGYPSGSGYQLCKEICGLEGHAEVMAIRNALQKTKNLKGASMYLAGHWWICKSCWDEIIKVGINRVYLNKDSIGELIRKTIFKRRKK